VAGGIVERHMNVGYFRTEIRAYNVIPLRFQEGEGDNLKEAIYAGFKLEATNARDVYDRICMIREPGIAFTAQSSTTLLKQRNRFLYQWLCEELQFSYTKHPVALKELNSRATQVGIQVRIYNPGIPSYKHLLGLPNAQRVIRLLEVTSNGKTHYNLLYPYAG